MKTLLNLFSIKLVVSLLGLAYSILQVRYFGASRTIEIFFAAQTLVYLVTSLTQGGKLAEIFLPEYHKLEYIEKGKGFEALNVVINRMLLFGMGIIALVFLITPFIVQLTVPGFSDADQAQAVLMFRALLPYLFIQIVNSFYLTMLQAEEKFERAELLGVINSIVNIVTLLTLYSVIGIWALVVALLLGKIIEFIFFRWQLKQIGYHYQRILNTTGFDHKIFFKAMQSTFLYVGTTQVYSIVLTASISFLPEGTYAIFKYVQNLTNKIRSFFVQPFITIFFTTYSKLFQQEKSVLQLLNKNITSILSINMVLIIGSILLGDFIIDLIWGGEKFDASDVKLAYIFLLFNIMAILFSSIGAFYRKMAVANHKGMQLYFYWSFSQIASAGITYFLIKYFAINGLYFIVPINVFLMGIASYFVYKTTSKPIKHTYRNTYYLYLLVSILFSYCIKFSFSLIAPKFIIILIFASITGLFSIYPMLKIFQLFRNEK